MIQNLAAASGELWLRWFEGPNDSRLYCRGDSQSVAVWVAPDGCGFDLGEGKDPCATAWCCPGTADPAQTRPEGGQVGRLPVTEGPNRRNLRGIAPKHLPGSHNRRSPSVLDVAEGHTHDNSAQSEMLSAITAKRRGTTVQNVSQGGCRCHHTPRV